jgi:hypothetical protein
MQIKIITIPATTAIVLSALKRNGSNTPIIPNSDNIPIAIEK